MVQFIFQSESTIRKLKKDVLILLVSFGITVVLVRSGVIESLFMMLGTWGLLGVFIAGMGFSSVWFAAPATAAVFIFAQHMPFWVVAPLAALGSMAGDYVVLQFLRHGIVEDLTALLEERKLSKRWPMIFRSRLFYWFTSFVAAIIIASPLPDEIGLVLLAALRFDVKRFLPIAFVLNFLGILIIAMAAHLH